MIHDKLKEAFIKLLQRTKQLETDEVFQYHLTKLDSKEKSCFVSTSIEPSDFDVLLAYIQFLVWDKNISHRISPSEISSLLKEHFNVLEISEKLDIDDTDYAFDLDEVFEEWAEYSSSIQEINVFKSKLPGLEVSIDEILKQRKEGSEPA